MSTNVRNGWIGVDLDGTLAHYDRWRGVEHIGEPVPAMLKRVKDWLYCGRQVRIMTARVSSDDSTDARRAIEAWLEKHGIGGLKITCVKDYSMLELWDDRAVQVITNTGERVDGKDPPRKNVEPNMEWVPVVGEVVDIQLERTYPWLRGSVKEVYSDSVIVTVGGDNFTVPKTYIGTTSLGHPSWDSSYRALKRISDQ